MAKQADARAKHLQKQLAEEKKALGSKNQEAVKLQADLAKQRSVVDTCIQRSPPPAWADGDLGILRPVEQGRGWGGGVQPRETRMWIDINLLSASLSISFILPPLRRRVYQVMRGNPI